MHAFQVQFSVKFEGPTRDTVPWSISFCKKQDVREKYPHMTIANNFIRVFIPVQPRKPPLFDGSFLEVSLGKATTKRDFI